MIYESLTSETVTFVTNLFRLYQSKEMLYHNLDHTKSVVEKCKLIAAQYILTAPELFTIEMAAWFHDTGHLFGDEVGHEEKSVIIMRDFFEHKIDKKLLKDIGECILATRLPATPNNLLQMIVCDADLFHLGTPDFFCMNELVKKEYQWRHHTQITGWQSGTLAFMARHEYFTSYCKAILNKGKEENMKVLREEIQ